jgi:nicotinamide-nucleotide amidase
MRAEIICVGTELLLGDIVNTNASWLARELAEVGVGVYKQLVVGDNHNRLAMAIKDALDENDVVICTGGLGPTQDDMTKEALADACNLDMVENLEARKWLEERFNRNGYTLTQNNYRQAVFPKGSVPLYNENGSAPGCKLEIGQKVVYLLPGPPREMQPMYYQYIRPYLESKTDGVLRSVNLRIIGVGESSAEEMAKDIINKQSNPTIAPYAHFGELSFRITAKAASEVDAFEMIKPVIDDLKKVFDDNIYGYDDDNIEKVVVKKLIESNMTVSIAESCTGGLLTSHIVNVPGSSKVLMQSVVAYSNQAKIDRLGVKEETLLQYGAVSKEVAKEMAIGIAKSSGTDIGIATTGLAGPGGGSKDKPVGLVYIAFYINGCVTVEEHLFKSSREGVRRRSVLRALDSLRRRI